MCPSRCTSCFGQWPSYPDCCSSLLGAVAFPKSVELCMQAVNAPGPDAAKTVAGLITMAIVGGLAILGAFLICRGTRPAMAS